MPLTPKGEEIKSALQKEYGAKKGEQVLYAGANKGTFTGIHNDRRDQMTNSDGGPGSGPGPGVTGGPSESALQRSIRNYTPPPKEGRPSGSWGSKSKPAGIPSQHKAKAESAAQRSVKTYSPPQRDQTKPDPASGPMSTGGPNGTSENLPKTTEPFAARDGGMSLDTIKAMGKRIGRY
jgi:hypothetical protein